MKPIPQEPTVAAAVTYFVDMAKGKTQPSRQNGRNGLGAVRSPSTYHVIPNVKLVTPSAQALIQAQDSLMRGKVIRGARKRNANELGLTESKQKKKKTKKKKSSEYLTPALD